MTSELEQECRKWFYEMAFVPANPTLIDMPYGYDMNYIKSLREIVGKYIKGDFDIVKGYGDFGIEIRLKEIKECVLKDCTEQSQHIKSEIQQLFKEDSQ